METIEFKRDWNCLHEKVLMYRCLIIEKNYESIGGTNSDGEDNYDEAINIRGWSQWKEVP